MKYATSGCVNPYNFIEFPKVKAKAYSDTDKHTGYIEYTLETKTPLFIPNSSSESAFSESDSEQNHKSYDFFSYSELDENNKDKYDNEYNEPVIPGSEIRGVIRSVYETLTDSCMRVLNEDEHPVKRTYEKFKPGLIYRNVSGSFELIPASSAAIGYKAKEGKLPPNLNLKNGCRNGSVVYIKNKISRGKNIVIKDYKDSMQEEYNIAGYLLKWGMGFKKKRYHILVPDIKGKAIKQLSKEDIYKNINDIIDSYVSQCTENDINKGAYEEYRSDFQAFMNNKGNKYFPVNYSVINKDIIYLSPAVLTKEISVNSIGELAGVFKPCNEDNICPACDLFGYIGDDNEICSGSKVRFSDLYVTNKENNNRDYYLRDKDKVTIPALSGPKFGNVEFYLKKPAEDATFWTYDYYVDKNGNVHAKQGELRGRKFYWHHSKVSIRDINTNPTKLNKTIRPVKEGIEFTGRLYYEGISKKQLNQLVWILGNGKEGLGYKLGGAKPFGFGSVMSTVNKVVERHIFIKDNRLAYTIDECKDNNITYEDAGFSKTVENEFKKIASLKPFPEGVCISYPKEKPKGDEKGYEWFENNHIPESKDKTRKVMKINETLPYILDEKYILSYNKNLKPDEEEKNKFKKERGNNSNYKGRNSKKNSTRK